MKNINFNSTYFKILILLLSFISTLIGTPFQGVTFFVWVVEFFLLVYLIKITNFRIKIHGKSLFILPNIYLFYNISSFLVGLFISENYWDFKALFNNSLGLFSSFIFYVALRSSFVKAFLTNYLRFSLPLIFVLIPFQIYGYGFYCVPTMFILLFWPVIKKPWNYLIIIFTVCLVVIDIGTRSTLLKNLAAFLIPFLYFFRNTFSRGFLEFFRKIFMFLPFLLLLLGFIGIFNIFQIGSGNNESLMIKEKSYTEKGLVETNLSEDTRSFLYEEAFYSANKLNFWIFGRTPARGHLSFTFGDLDPANRGERAQDEVAILNIFVWTGLVGVLLYFFIFYQATFLAINKSQNIFSKIVGLFVLFRWLFAWVEDPNVFNLTNIFIWILIAFCYSEEFRNMTNSEMINWINSVFFVKKKTFNFKH
ncbi:MAG: hypothetical protein K9I82_12450 [Chitinophagaceae bacterium]|nr:hypothetical protein [Chitinophagaceae bacterium]